MRSRWPWFGLALAATVAGASEARSQPVLRDLLSLYRKEEGGRVEGRVFLDTVKAGVQGFSFGLCHETSDVVLEDAASGSGLVKAGGPAGASFVSVRVGGSPGAGHVTMAAVLDFDERSSFDVGSHELLVLGYSGVAGGAGRSIRFCAAGDPPVETLVIREGRGVEPRTQQLDRGADNSVRATAGVQGTRGQELLPNGVPIYLTTNRAGLTGFTVVLCHEKNVLGIGDVAATPEIMPFDPSIILGSPHDEFPSIEHTKLGPRADCTDCTKGGFRVSVELAAPLPRVSDLPVLRVFYSVLGQVGQTTSLSFCRVGVGVFCVSPGGGVLIDGGFFFPGGIDGSIFNFDFYDPIGEVCNSTDTLTVLRFGDERVYPDTVPGSFRVAFQPRHTTILPSIQSPATDPIKVDVSLYQADLLEHETRSLSLSAAFDPALFQIVPEAATRDHRGGALSAWIASEPGPATDSHRYEEGFFSYSVDLSACAFDVEFFPQPITFAKFRLARKSLPLPGGGEGPVAGGPFPLELKPLVLGGQTVATNQFRAHVIQNSCGVGLQTRSPALENGSLTIADSGIRLKPSSAEVEIYEPAEISIALDARVPGIAGLTYTVTHDPQVLAIQSVGDSPEVKALRPQSSVFERRAGGFTHTLVLEPGAPLRALQDFTLARVTYLPVGRGGQSSRIDVVSSGELRPVVVLPIGGAPAAYVPTANPPGAVALKEDATLLAFKVPTLRAPPGGKLPVPVFLDAAAPGVASVKGALCHDATRPKTSECS